MRSTRLQPLSHTGRGRTADHQRSDSVDALTGAAVSKALLDGALRRPAVIALTMRAASRPTPWIIDEDIA